MENVTLPAAPEVLLIILLAAWTVGMAYLLKFYVPMAWLYVRADATNRAQWPAVSVVIAARNERDNLEKNLPHIFKQQYPTFEVIVVNDGSWDDSAEFLEALQATESRLRVVNRRESEHRDMGKKLAITLGIKRAQYERLLFTDADCRPLSDQWIKHMVAAVDQPDTLVLGYSPFARVPGPLNAFVRFTGLYNAIHYLGFALAGVPYMGVGRNLSYSRSKFFEIGGFKRHYSLASGDDDLFVNEVARRDNTVVCVAAEAIVETAAPKSWKAFWQQRRRHLTTGWRYRRYHRLLLTIEPLALMLMYAMAVALLVLQLYLWVVLGLLGFRLIAQILIFRRSSRCLGQADVAWLSPFLELGFLVMNAAAMLANTTSKPGKWKN